MGAKEYTYSELVQLGGKEYNDKTKHVYASYWDEFFIYNSSKFLRLPILRNGAVIWLAPKDITPIELNAWKTMFIGMASIPENGKVGSHIYARSLRGFNTVTNIQLPPKHSDTHSDSAEYYEKAAQVWGIPRHLNITSKAALFYLLHIKHLRGDKSASLELRWLIDSLAPLVVRYLDMVVGGEARHASSRFTHKANFTQVPGLQEEINECEYLKYAANGKAYLSDGGKDVTAGFEAGSISRSGAWIKWKELREKYGKSALLWSVVAHNSCPIGGYCGPLWGNASLLVNKYEKQEISGLFLVDQAFSLQHNGGVIFNKLWEHNGLVQVLNKAFEGKLDGLDGYLQGEDKDTFKRLYRGVTELEGVKHEGTLVLAEKQIATFETSTVLQLSREEDVVVRREV